MLCSPLLLNLAAQYERKPAHFSEILPPFCSLPILTLCEQTPLCWHSLLRCKCPWSPQCAVQKGFRNQAVNIWKCHTHDTAICSHNCQSFVPQKEAEDSFLHFMLYSNLNLRNYRQYFPINEYSINTTRSKIMSHTLGFLLHLKTIADLLGLLN